NRMCKGVLGLTACVLFLERTLIKPSWNGKRVYNIPLQKRPREESLLMSRNACRKLSPGT
ncbi:hypothetical protein NDU88_008115, partial [Pleurodeles waltl]